MNVDCCQQIKSATIDAPERIDARARARREKRRRSCSAASGCERRTGRGARFQRFPVAFPLAVSLVRVKPFRKDGGGNRNNADESPLPLRVFHELADDERRQDTCRSHPMADFAGDSGLPAVGTPAMLFLLPLRMLSLAAHSNPTGECSRRL
jgi:hypothetical protein